MRWKGSKADLKAALRKLPGVLAGRETDTLGLHPLFWGLVGNAVLRLLRDGFEVKQKGGRALDGVRWRELAAATLAKRRREGREDGDILIETGQLMLSLEPGDAEHPNPAAPDQVFRVFRDGVEVGTADRTADRHQNGTEYMPARPIVPTGDPNRAWEAEIEHAAQQALVAVIERVVEAGGL